MKYCEKCNKYYSEDKRYCSECGCILINKDKSQNSSKAGNVHCDIENLEIPPYEHFLMQFLIPTVIGLSIAELIFTWQMLATGIPKILDGFWGSFVFYVVICAGLTKAREWLIEKYAGNTEMRTFGISRTILSDLENALSWLYPVVEILCGILCLRYAGEVLELFEGAPDWTSVEFYVDFLLVCLRWAYKVKDWVMIPKGVELLWNISTVHRKFDKDIKIGGVWKKSKERILNCLP